ncbi:hypothetical protein EC991_000414 [Linnemannia zychae]|nr:hypothetical protein EC991_000414 [Linnemannia zychae]
MTLWEIVTTNPRDWTLLSAQGSLAFTMWNNLQYNLDKDNLALHGLHPREDLKTRPEILGLFRPQDINTFTTRVVFYKTYMPPHHLFGYNASQALAHGVQLEILDWRSKSKEQLVQDLVSKENGELKTVDRKLLQAARDKHLGGQQAVLFRETQPGSYERTVLIAPGTVDFSDQEFDTDGTKHRISRHANLDHLPELLQHPLIGLTMNVFYL